MNEGCRAVPNITEKEARILTRLLVERHTLHGWSATKA
jgi:hypothetical protein